VPKAEYPPEFLERVRAVTAKRPKVVIDHILKHGSITTSELQELGYNHPPRAARDVREQGIPLVTTRVRDSEGRSIGAYTFGNPDDLIMGLTGRKAISKKFKKRLIEITGPICAACGLTYAERYLQVDHRIPVEVAGDEPDEDREPDRYQLLCGSCNTAKAWSCRNCPNLATRDPNTCRWCYWSDPKGGYKHVATVPERRVVLVWQGGGGVRNYTDLAAAAKRDGKSLPDYIRDRLR
jgi:hypothetical protein